MPYGDADFPQSTTKHWLKYYADKQFTFSSDLDREKTTQTGYKLVLINLESQ